MFFNTSTSTVLAVLQKKSTISSGKFRQMNLWYDYQICKIRFHEGLKYSLNELDRWATTENQKLFYVRIDYTMVMALAFTIDSFVFNTYVARQYCNTPRHPDSLRIHPVSHFTNGESVQGDCVTFQFINRCTNTSTVITQQHLLYSILMPAFDRFRRT